jgi:hypothetical protein
MADDFDTSDLVRLLATMPRGSKAPSQVVPDWLIDQQREAQSAQGPLHGARFPSGVFEPAAIAAEATGVPSVVRGVHDIQDENNLTKAKGAAEIAIGAVPALSAVRRTAPLIDTLFGTAPRAFTSSMALGTPQFMDAAMAETPAEARAREMSQLQGDIAKHRQAITDTTIKIGQTRFRGNDQEAGLARQKAIEEATRPYNDAIRAAQDRIGTLQTANDADAKEQETRGAPLREMLPPILSKTVPVWTGAIGAGLTRGVFNKFNAEYNAALNGYRAAETTGNAAEMAMRRAQLKDLEANTPWKNPVTYLAAGVPMELRTLEHVIDMRNDPETRAYKEANARQHDPWAVAQDVGTGILSAGTALGLGAKFSKDQPERSLGRAIVSGEGYADAPALARQYGTALQAGEDLRGAYPSLSPRPPEERSLLQRLLGIGRPEAAPSPPPTARPATSGPSPPVTTQDLTQVLASQPRMAERLEGYRRALPPPEPQPGPPEDLPPGLSATPNLDELAKTLSGLRPANNPLRPRPKPETDSTGQEKHRGEKGRYTPGPKPGEEFEE